ncbi:MAG: toll/interleukin-1 receptor domain-containing protein [Cyanobacteria bacterium P01_A01_bin.37]
MTELYDAFISYGRTDSKAFAARLCQQLTAKGYRVWLDMHDIPLGVDYQQQIDGDLERSHNFLFIMSPHSINSSYCRLEVERAVARHKRIIPILHVDEISRDTWQQRHPNGTDMEWDEYQAQNRQFGDIRNPRIHPILSKLNWVNMRDGQDDVEASFAGLIDIFDRHRDYVHQHTQLLAHALEWERHHRRSHDLLVGQPREQAEAWLKTRFKQAQAPCTPSDLHCEFITESIKNANNLMTQVFIAHAEDDTAVMAKVRRSLWREGITVWTSDTDIQTGEEFQQSIERGIEQADNLVYLLSPNAVQSAYCQQELDYALSLNKRIIPILVSPTEVTSQPSGLQGLQYIDLTDNEQEDDYRLDESQLLRILRTDEPYYQTHKVLLTKALKWDQQHRNPSILLRGYNRYLIAFAYTCRGRYRRVRELSYVDVLSDIQLCANPEIMLRYN